jgi:hypothetical protein
LVERHCTGSGKTEQSLSCKDLNTACHTQTLNISSGIRLRFLTTLGPLLVVAEDRFLFTFNCSVNPASPGSRFGTLRKLDVGSAAGLMAPRPGPGLSNRILVSHYAGGGLWEYSVDGVTGAIDWVAQRSTIDMHGVADSGTLVCLSDNSLASKVYCHNNAWTMVATLTVPITENFTITMMSDTDMPGSDYNVGVPNLARGSPSSNNSLDRRRHCQWQRAGCALPGRVVSL